MDGHHQLLAAENEGEPTVWAFVGRVDSKTGPWDVMNSSQVRESEREMVEPGQVYCRVALAPGRRGGTCDMSHLRKKPRSNVMAGSCDIQRIVVDDEHECNTWKT